ncbi:hypothetical protein ACQEVZ_24590 [Dactylosporangium sp. CA-152071]|uniref:hypothetical protein n=1 Tax=Dactylosporangium sp. CA-152071 TaxID=3239933 RepID=UPI003D944738
MRRTVLALTVAAGLAVACGGTPKADPNADPPAAATTPASVAPTTAASPRDLSSAEAANGIPPKPDAATQAAYIADLKAIDPDIVGKKDEDRIVGRGRDQCSSIKSFPNDRAKLVELTNKRFTSPNHPEGFGLAKAAKILDVVHKRLCPTYPMG